MALSEQNRWAKVSFMVFINTCMALLLNRRSFPVAERTQIRWRTICLNLWRIIFFWPFLWLENSQLCEILAQTLIISDYEMFIYIRMPVFLKGEYMFINRNEVHLFLEDGKEILSANVPKDN